MNLASLPEVRDLPVREKLELVDELWVSVGRELDSLEISDEAKDLLDSRWEAFLSDTTSAVTADEFRDRLKTRRA